MSEKKEDKNHEKENVRHIKQVYLSDDGSEETAVTSKIVEKTSPHGNEHIRDEVRHEKNHAVRIAAVAMAMVFSIILSMAVGVALALWDGHRTLSELNTVLFAHYVSAATRDDESIEAVEDPAPEEAISIDENSKGTSDEALPEDGPEGKEEDVPASEDDGTGDYGMTMAGIEGFESVAKADEDDEIAGIEEEDEPETIKDPLEDYPLPFTTVDESYFTDALFIGDSRLQGFGFWSGLPATYYCATGFQLYKYDTTKVVQTENGKVPIFDAMPYDAFTKIYIKVGLNELGYGTEENFEAKYAELIEKLREYEPRAVIYVHAILPVTEAKSATDKAHNNPNIAVRNAGLEKFAKTQKAYFLDAGPVLSDLAGNLKPEMTSDGIHLKPEYMKIWRQYLCEHAIVIQ
ncbi:MAG: hypothetical protein IJI51_09550 [Lachnospiraceae bacterium]|nr:hypothetical protein [Lachnospiraceae bacterium]